MNREETDPSCEPERDCAAALRILDLARPGETEPAVLASASAHVAVCDTCRAIARRRERFDTRVATLCRDVAPPTDGRERLLKALATAASGVGASASADVVAAGSPIPAVERVSGITPAGREADGAGSQSRVASRRRMLRAVIAALLMLAVGGGTLWFRRLPATNFQAILTAVAAVNWSASGLPELLRLQDGQSPRLPEEMVTRFINTPPRELTVERVKSAVFFFQFPRRGARQVQGALAVVPVSQLSSRPQSGGFLANPPLVDGELCATTWIEGNLAYICCVKGTTSDLQELALPRPAA